MTASVQHPDILRRQLERYVVSGCPLKPVRRRLNHIFALRNRLPDSYLGRRIEYAFEIDYFWIEHKGKISGFFGHVVKIPGSAKKILDMYRGKSNLFTGKGLLNPDWIFPRIGKIKLIIDIHRGYGSDPKGLDELIRILKTYHLENSVMVAGHSAWPLAYLKSKLPKIYTILVSLKLLGFRFSIPIHRPGESYLKFGFGISKNKMPFVDCLCASGNSSEEKVMKTVKESLAIQMDHLEWVVKSKEKLEWLIKHGVRGAVIEAELGSKVSPETIIHWLTTPPETE